MDQPQATADSRAIVHQEADALRTLLLVLLASLRRDDRISADQLDDIFWTTSQLVGERWGPNSVASIVVNRCRDELTEAKPDPPAHPGRDSDESASA